jgi:hypothetical protein
MLQQMVLFWGVAVRLVLSKIILGGMGGCVILETKSFAASPALKKVNRRLFLKNNEEEEMWIISNPPPLILKK